MNLSKVSFLKNKKIVAICLVSFILICVSLAFIISRADETAGIQYRAHVAYNGWLPWQNDGGTAGTVGESRRLEALKIRLTGNMEGSVIYQAFVRGDGWQNEVRNSETAGTEGQSKQMEAIKIRLEGKVAEYYNVLYRVHVKNKGWLDWVSNGTMAGSDSAALRIEAIEIKLERKEVKTGSGESPFTKYELTDYQLKSIASLCQQEQGTAEGAAAEASLMANHMDLRHNNARKYENNGTGLYNYVRNGGWFAHAARFMDDHSKLRGDVLEAVRKVLVEGKRTVPGYVNEHDCFSDIASSTNDGAAIGIRDRGAYIQNKTIIRNTYGSQYTFYCFPTSTSDPFGYTSEAKRQEIGDFCYNFSDI